MSVETVKEFLDRKIADLSAELEQAKALRAAVDNRQLFGQISELMTQSNGAVNKQAGGEQSNRQKVAEFFLTRENEWASSADIMQATGMDRGTVNNILYVAYKNRFESKSHPKLKRRTLWRMKPQS